jgi:hypothetical protein
MCKAALPVFNAEHFYTEHENVNTDREYLLRNDPDANLIAELDEFLMEEAEIENLPIIEFNLLRSPPPKKKNKTIRIQDRSNRKQIRDQTRTYKTIEQYWDYTNPCQYCNYICLISTPIRNRHLCCNNGKFLQHPYPQLNPLPPQLKRICTKYTSHMSAKSAFYNNILSIAQTTVENGRTGRYEKIAGPHALRMNGRVHHFIPRITAKDRRGLAYFTYDCAAVTMQEHVKEINAKMKNIKHTIEYQFLEIFFNEMVEVNVYVKQV